MECTQRLECTQELYASQSERLHPQQIGILGICGTKYPVKKGPNKIGRDPQTCDIVLNLNSISRQHAVINVLNGNNIMVMDLDSANKTKLSGKTLQAYIPQPLKNGDMVQFGQVFGVFRLLEEDNDLPLTQAVDIPETPIVKRHASRINNIPSTTIPESPDVSDRDDSFIKPSQTNDDRLFKSPNNKLIKPSGKTISIQPIGTNKIDNVFWNSSKKSNSLNLDDSTSGLDDSTLSVKADNTLVKENKIDDFYDMETQIPLCSNQNHIETLDSIYTAETQIPDLQNIGNIKDSSLDSTNKENDLRIHNAETELLSDIQNKNDTELDPDLFEAETQVPIIKNNVCNSSESKNNHNSSNIHDAATQIPISSGLIANPVVDENDLIDTQTISQEKKNIVAILDMKSESFINKSDDIIVFDEVDAQCFEDNFDSQPLLPLSSSLNDANESTQPKLIDFKEEIKATEPNKRSVRIISDGSTDCEDFNIVPTQKLIHRPISDDLTDCEDEEPEPRKTSHDEDVNSQDGLCDSDFDILPTQKLLVIDAVKDLTNCDENFETKCNGSKVKDRDTNFEDQPTQILTDIISKPLLTILNNGKNEPEFEDMLTQVLVEDQPEKKAHIEDFPTEVLDNSTAVSYKSSSQLEFSEEIVNPFKVPLPTPRKVKKKDTQKPLYAINSFKYKNEEDDKYYAATQDIFEDLCSQREVSPELIKTVDTDKNKMNTVNTCHLSHLDKEVLIYSDKIKLNGVNAVINSKKSFDNSDTDHADENVTNFVKSLTCKQIREVIGVATPPLDHKPATLRRMPSDPSDVEITPKKVRPFKLMETDLPNSQEIKTNVFRKSLYTDSSSESEQENDTQEENTPILFRPKKRNNKKDAKVDLTKAFEAKALPSRIITRVRKPTSKIQEADAVTKKNNRKILKPQFLTEQEDNIDSEILTENITRLRNKNEKKNKSVSSKSDEVKKEKTSKISDIKSRRTDNAKELDSKNKNKQIEKKTNKKKPKTSNELKSEPQNKSILKEKTNYKKASEKSIIIHSKEEINYENSKGTSKMNEPISPTSSNKILDNTHRTTKNMRLGNRSKNNGKSEKTLFTSETNRRNIKVKVKLKDEEDLSPKKEIRRSKRNRNDKKKNESLNTEKHKTIHEFETLNENENPEYKPKSILKNSKSLDNQSAVYNISSESGTESPKNLKRSAMLEIDVPSPKRSRSCRSSNTSSLRSTPARGMQTQFVLFTAFPSEEVKLKLEALGAIIVGDVKDCTVVLTMQIKRTFKLLCAVGLGKPIVGPSWVQACVDNCVIVDPWLYLIKDEVSENRFHFSLERTLTSRRQFLKGYNVSCTPSVMPNAAEMKLIVECSGGTWKAQKPQWVCVSCHADKSQWDALRQQGAIIVSTEFILSGVLRQRADLKNNRLDISK